MKKIILYIHGKGGSYLEAEQYKKNCIGFDIIGIDFNEYFPWIVQNQIQSVYNEARERYDSIYVIANSIGAYFVMHTLQNCDIEKALFISPVLDMERLILDMMSLANISEKDLCEKGEIPTDFGETLSWKYLCFVRENPITWNVPTEILYAGNDNLISRQTVNEFISSHNAHLTVMENGEHWFHTDEQLAFLDAWMKEAIRREPGMVRIDEYIDELIDTLNGAFGERLAYIGLQGSYLRNEETKNSDIDIMAVIDNLSVEDLKTYQKALVSIGNFDKSCGFICSKADLKHWNPLEICHLLNTTKDYYGELKNLVPAYTMEDERNYVKISLNNFYHEICHRYIHADIECNIAKLPITCKSVFFIMQHLHYLSSGNFIPTKRELLECIQDEDKTVLELSIALQNNIDYDFDKAFSALFHWCQSALARMQS